MARSEVTGRKVGPDPIGKILSSRPRGPHDGAIFLTAKQLAARWSMTEAALSQMRHRGTGPAFIIINEKVVRYPLDGVEDMERRFRSMSEVNAARPERAAYLARLSKDFNRGRPMGLAKRLDRLERQRAATESR